MKISEIVTMISSERFTPGRFPSRLVFVRNFDDYLMLVNELKALCDVVIDLAQFTKDDILPKFKDLKVEMDRHDGKQLLILSFGEYLRICTKREIDRTTSVFPGIWEKKQSERSTTKYIIPIFGGREIFDQVLPLQDERQQRFIWEVNESLSVSDYTLTIYSPDFADAVVPDAENLHEWFESWTTFYSDKGRHNFSLRTKLYRYAEARYGENCIKIVDEPFSYVASLVKDGEKLKKEYGEEDFWRYIAKNVRHGEPFAETIKHLLNIGHSFDAIGVFARFNGLSDIEQNLLLIWYKLYPSDDYCTFAINKISIAAEIPITLRDAIFDLSQLTDAYIHQRTAVLRVLDIFYSEDYFKRLDKITSPETRLKMLTYKTIAERSFAIKTISGLLRNGADIDAVAQLVRAGYPELAEYLNPTDTPINAVSQYFNWYRHTKLINRPNIDVPCIIDFDNIDSRNKIVQKNYTVDSTLFWVDGLGVEWLPILTNKLKNLKDILVKPEVAKALLPTETKYNRKWKPDDIKWDRLDKLSHVGIPDDKDYFLCIAHQLEIINEVVEHIKELLTKVNRVILTSDHGSSRLAALLFHDTDNFAIKPPNNSRVHSLGRFVELKDDTFVPITPSMEMVEVDGVRFIVMKTYEHFIQSGNAAGGNTDDKAIAGEIHGGKTPEEFLVPVIVITRKTLLPCAPTIKKSTGIAYNDDKMGLP